jgi:hypothetical protein
LRWVGKLKALYARHELLVQELKKRGYKHNSPLDKRLASGEAKQNVFINTLAEQEDILRNKPCQCFSGATSNQADQTLPPKTT